VAQRRRHVLTLLAALAATAPQAAVAETPDEAEREREPVVVWPTLTPAEGELRRPTEREGALTARAQELDATLRDGAQDLGLKLELGDPGPAPGRTRDLDLLDRAARARTGASSAEAEGTWVVSPRLEPAGTDRWTVRLVVVAPDSNELRVRVETVRGQDVAVRGLVMLRGLLAPRSAAPRDVAAPAPPAPPAPARSPGRTVLAVNAALFGGAVAYSLHRSTGSDDPRVLYPLMAIGTGVGLGGALLAAEEWNVGLGDAWFLSAGAWWGATAGILYANHVTVQPLSARYAWGVGGGVAGVALATLALARGHMDEGGATLTHSGAALGLLVGGAADLAAQGTLDGTPAAGAGIGTTVGLIGAGFLATQVHVAPSRVFLIDLGAGLGTLGGAALASPLLFEDVRKGGIESVDRGKSRAFLVASMAGTVAGGALAFWLTRDRPAATATRPGPLRAVPTAGVIASSPSLSGAVPAYGVGVLGSF